MTGFGDKEVTKLAAHPEGKHFLALSADGDVYSWGNGDGGRLGHGDNKLVHVLNTHCAQALATSVSHCAPSHPCVSVASSNTVHQPNQCLLNIPQHHLEWHDCCYSVAGLTLLNDLPSAVT